MRHSTAGLALALMALALGVLPAVSFAGSAPTGAPTFPACLSYVAPNCVNPNGQAGAYYSLGRIVGADAWVWACATLNGTGMCTPTLQRWSTLTPGTWVARDRVYTGRTEGTTFGAFPGTGIMFDSVAYASGDMWVIDSAEVLEVMWVLVGMVGVLIVAVTFRVAT